MNLNVSTDEYGKISGAQATYFHAVKPGSPFKRGPHFFLKPKSHYGVEQGMVINLANGETTTVGRYEMVYECRAEVIIYGK